MRTIAPQETTPFGAASRSRRRPVTTIGIIGAGAFGRFAARHLAAGFAVSMSDPDPAAEERARASGLTVAPFEQVAAADVVLLAVPWRTLPTVAARLAPHLSPRALIVDVASIKVEPLAILRAALPGRAIVGLHPLFGPQSGAAGLVGLPVAHCTSGTPSDRRVARYLEETLKLRRVAVTAEEHDREMGRVQGLTHVIARALKALAIAETPLATRSFAHLARMVDIVGNDSEAVFQTIVADNPHAAVAARSFQAALADVIASTACHGENPDHGDVQDDAP